MKTSVFYFVLGLSLCIRTATTEAETVWLRDVTTRFLTDKHTLNDPELPDHLNFNLKRKSHALTLNLKRNHHIDPNADVYIVRKLKDGQSHLEKKRILEKENVAYYQDRENMAFMTAKCVRRSSGQCDILINGNIRIGDRNYDLQPSETDVTSRNFLKTTGRLDKLYVLQEQENSQREIPVEHKDEKNVYEKNLEEKLADFLQRIPHGEDKQKQFILPDLELSTGNVAGLRKKGATGDNRRETNNKYDTIRNLKKEYYVDAAVLIDSSVWDLFVTLSETSHHIEEETIKSVRRWYSHIINGVDLLYKGIEDPNIEISVSIRGFVLFQTEAEFPHDFSKVEIFNEIKMIDVNRYLYDLLEWDLRSGHLLMPQYDQAILFTRIHMHFGDGSAYQVAGLSYTGHICDRGKVQLVRSYDYFQTVQTAAHELGHSLGATHDGDLYATSCPAEAFNIMSPLTPVFDPNKEFSRNPWLFSKCSVEAFKNIDKNKQCLTSKGNYSDADLDEWYKFMSERPGEVYYPNMQCHIINGRGSFYYGKFPGMMCRFMYCTDPKTRKCLEISNGAATGTACGTHMWCKNDCVLKIRNRFEPQCATFSMV